MMKAWIGAGMGGAAGIIIAWWMRKARGWEVGEDVQSAFGSIATGIFSTIDNVICAIAALIGDWLQKRRSTPEVPQP